MGTKIDIFIFDRSIWHPSVLSARNCILFLGIQLLARLLCYSVSRHATREGICAGNFFARALVPFASRLNDRRLLLPNAESKYYRAVSGREERQMCRGIMKFAEKICEADVSNVTRSVPSFYANKSGGRLISPWCSDAAVAIAVVNIGVGDGVGVGVDTPGRRSNVSRRYDSSRGTPWKQIYRQRLVLTSCPRFSTDSPGTSAYVRERVFTRNMSPYRAIMYLVRLHLKDPSSRLHYRRLIPRPSFEIQNNYFVLSGFITFKSYF